MGLDYTPHAAVLQHVPLVDGLARAIGPGCEIVLHDLRHPSNSLVHIAGSITNRQIGAPVTNVVLEALRQRGDGAPDLFNYRSESPSGRSLRSSTLFIRDRDRIVGALCINLDVTPYEDLAHLASRALTFEDHRNEVAERFDNTVGDVLDGLIASVLKDRAVRPSHMAADDRLQVIASLEERGVFLIKGSVDMVARRLGVSKFTVYGYLQQVRAIRELGGAESPAVIDSIGRTYADGKE